MKWKDKNLDTSPLVGDKIVCLRNNWSKTNALGDALVNGTIGKISDISTSPNLFLGTESYIDFEVDSYEDIPLILDNSNFSNVLIDWKLFTTGEPTLNKDNFRTFPKKFRPNEFDYGYAITCWKAQGSEWSKVLAIEERFPFDKQEHKQYLYTVTTRARDKLTLVLNQ